LFASHTLPVLFAVRFLNASANTHCQEESVANHHVGCSARLKESAKAPAPLIWEQTRPDGSADYQKGRACADNRAQPDLNPRMTRKHGKDQTDHKQHIK
jgi:hypothetical protein